VTVSAVALCVLVQGIVIVGELFLKRAMSPGGVRHAGGPIVWRWLFMGVACFSLWFFLWLGILARWDISQVYPFDALNSAGIAIAARLVLNEKLPARGWLGVALISAGIVVVSQS
jgi:uncharacterized membrane protein